MDSIQTVLRDGLVTMFLTGIISSIFAPIMIFLLYRFGQTSEIKKTSLGSFSGSNSLFMRIQNVTKVNGTPNMGGILIWITVPLMVLLTQPHAPEINVFIIAFAVFGFWGLVDVIFTNSIKNNERLRAIQETFEWRLGKLAFTILLDLGVMYMLFNYAGFSALTIPGIITISLTPIISLFMIPILAIVGQFAIYAAEITDGLDGLMVGIFMIIYALLLLLLLIQGQYTYIPIICIILGVLTVDLYFNIPPARFWNGGPGAMPLGFAAFFICLTTNNLIPYFFMTSITWGIMFSSMIQILSMKFFKRRVFKIAPLHHHFQAVGWPSYKVTMRFWLYTTVSCFGGILIALLVR